MGQHLSAYTRATYLQRVHLRLLQCVLLEEHCAALIAYHPIPMYGPQSACFGIVPLSHLKDRVLEHLENVAAAEPICLLSAYGTRSPETSGLLLVLRLCMVPDYDTLDCFEGAIREDLITGAVYVPHDDAPRLAWWRQTCASVAKTIEERQEHDAL